MSQRNIAIGARPKRLLSQAATVSLALSCGLDCDLELTNRPRRPKSTRHYFTSAGLILFDLLSLENEIVKGITLPNQVSPSTPQLR
jgi:hypothetical protein